jgi:hypothetical protein
MRLKTAMRKKSPQTDCLGKLLSQSAQSMRKKFGALKTGVQLTSLCFFMLKTRKMKMSILKRIQEIEEGWVSEETPEMETLAKHAKEASKSPVNASVVNIDGSPLTSKLAWPPRPVELAHWPIEWRERWGRLANALEDNGIAFPDSEPQAFAAIKQEMETAS